jgi:hypothetical protein
MLFVCLIRDKEGARLLVGIAVSSPRNLRQQVFGEKIQITTPAAAIVYSGCVWNRYKQHWPEGDILASYRSRTKEVVCL